MLAFINSAGGRKFLLTVLVTIVLALRNVLGLDDLAIKLIAGITGVGVGAIAIEDGLKAVGGTRAAEPTLPPPPQP
jgi:hypothetical protein